MQEWLSHTQLESKLEGHKIPPLLVLEGWLHHPAVISSNGFLLRHPLQCLCQKKGLLPVVDDTRKGQVQANVPNFSMHGRFGIVIESLSSQNQKKETPQHFFLSTTMMCVSTPKIQWHVLRLEENQAPGLWNSDRKEKSMPYAGVLIQHRLRTRDKYHYPTPSQNLKVQIEHYA